MSGSTIPLRLILLILLISLISPARASYPNRSGPTSGTIALPLPARAIKLNHYY